MVSNKTRRPSNFQPKLPISGASSFEAEYLCCPLTRNTSAWRFKAAGQGDYFTSNCIKRNRAVALKFESNSQCSTTKIEATPLNRLLNWFFVGRIDGAEGAEDFCDLFAPSNDFSGDETVSICAWRHLCFFVGHFVDSIMFRMIRS